MVWMNKVGAVGPIPGSWDDDGNPIPEDTNVSVGGHTWNVYKVRIRYGDCDMVCSPLYTIFIFCQFPVL